MALITCPDCSNRVSDAAAACPKCGKPLSEDLIRSLSEKLSQEDKQKSAQAESSKARMIQMKERGCRIALWLSAAGLLVGGLMYIQSASEISDIKRHQDKVNEATVSAHRRHQGEIAQLERDEESVRHQTGHDYLINYGTVQGRRERLVLQIQQEIASEAGVRLRSGNGNPKEQQQFAISLLIIGAILGVMSVVLRRRLHRAT